MKIIKTNGSFPKQRVLIAESWPSVTECLERIFAKDGRFEIVARVSSGLDGLRVFKKTRPDILITALSLTEMNGSELVAIIREEKPDIRVLIYTGTFNPDLLAVGFATSPHGFVHKTESLSELEKAIEAVFEGANHFSPRSSQLRADAHNQNCLFGCLTAKQKTVLKLIAESKSSKEIAEYLSISPKTVESYRAKFGKKLGLRDIAALTRHAVRIGLVNVTTMFLAPFFLDMNDWLFTAFSPVLFVC